MGQRCMAVILHRRIFRGILVATCIILFCKVCLKLHFNKNLENSGSYGCLRQETVTLIFRVKNPDDLNLQIDAVETSELA